MNKKLEIILANDAENLCYLGGSINATGGIL